NAWGCAARTGATAIASSANHEIVHIFVLNATDDARTRPGISEGIAYRLEGRFVGPPVYWRRTFSPAEFEELIATHDRGGIPRDSGQHFFAWAIDRHGIEAVLDAYVTTS